MSAEPERHALDGDGESFVHEQLAAMDGDLMRRIPSDARLESGVPEGQLSGALDFIQMTGLTRPPARKAPPGSAGGYASGPLHPDLDASAPLSFYEKGIADVDESMADGGFGSSLRDAALDADLVPKQGADELGAAESHSAKAFRDIIASLESHEDDAPAETAGEETYNFRESPSALSDDAVSALRSLVDDLATGGARPPAPPGASQSDDGSTSLEVEAPEELILPESSPDADETPLAPEPDAEPELNEIAPAVETPAEPVDAVDSPSDSMEDFDALLASLDTGRPAEDPQSVVPKAEAGPDADDMSEDWDALLDSVAKDNQSAERGSTASPTARGSLAAAEQLMDVLTKQPAPPESAGALALAGADDTTGYDYHAVPSRRRSRRHSRLARRGWRLVKLAILLVIITGAGGYLWWFVLAPLVEKPADLEASAASFMNSGKYADASAAYLQLARSSSADRADAHFQAAYALSLEQRDRGIDDTHARYNRALGLFEEFINDNPQHPKYTRALCIMGRLYYELGEADKAISILRDQVKPVDDPAAALAMLRYLARAYKMKGSYEEAETAYLQAATLPGNYSAETDYLELGEMFRTRAGLESDPAVRAKLEETADAYWKRGMQVPGIAPSQLDALQERLKWSAFAEESGDPAAPIPAADAPIAEVAEPVVAPETPPVSPVPAPENGMGQGPDPGVELQEMISGGEPAAASTPPAPESVSE